jgi:hypothetical protein
MSGSLLHRSSSSRQLQECPARFVLVPEGRKWCFKYAFIFRTSVLILWKERRLFSGTFVSAGTAGNSQINVLMREFHLNDVHSFSPYLTENTEKIRLMLFTKIGIVRSNNYSKHVNTMHGQNADFLNVNTMVRSFLWTGVLQSFGWRITFVN